MVRDAMILPAAFLKSREAQFLWTSIIAEGTQYYTD